MKYIILVLAISFVSATNWERELLSMPKALCKPAEKIGTTIALEVVKCAKGDAASKIPGSKAASALAAKAGVFKMTGSIEKKMAEKMVHTMLAKIGCKRRRLGWLKKLSKRVKSAGSHVKKVGTRVMNSKLAKKAKKMAKKVGGKALAMACKRMGKMCPKACDTAVNQAAGFMKKYKVPVKCASQVAKKACHDACAKACKK
jgi:hypothetical protein